MHLTYFKHLSCLTHSKTKKVSISIYLIEADQNSKPMFSTQKLGRWRTQARTNFESKQAYLKRSYGLLNRKNGIGF